jgi:hypothetical protein
MRFMLNLPVAMYPHWMLIFLLFLATIPNPGIIYAVTPGITSPTAGEALRGQVNIQGTTAVDRFESYEVTYSYGDSNASNWFLIVKSSSPVENGILASWDTQTISDGKYTLKLTIFLTGGKTFEAIVPDLRVRNYSIVETSTPPAQAEFTPGTTTIAEKATVTPRITPTLLPNNPAELTPPLLLTAVLTGVGGAVVGLAVIGLYSWRKHSRKGKRQ